MQQPNETPGNQFSKIPGIAIEPQTYTGAELFKLYTESIPTLVDGYSADIDHLIHGSVDTRFRCKLTTPFRAN